MAFPPIPAIGIVGLGQIGGSIALDMVGKTQVSFFARSAKTQQEGANAGIEVAMTLGELAARSDIIFVAVPVDQTVSVLSSLSPHLQSGQIVTDVSSTKERLVQAAEAISWPDGVEFIGGHPMAGTDKPGFAAAQKGMFRNRTWIFTADGNERDASRDACLRLANLVTAELGARVAVMDSNTHDRSVALVSHLEHVIALTLVNLVRDSNYSEMVSRLAAGSFLDATRVSKSASSMVVPFLADNRYLSAVSSEFRAEFSRICNQLGQPKNLLRLWDEGSDWRTRHEEAIREVERLELPLDSATVAEIMHLTREGKFVLNLEENGGRVLLELG